jgi:hypothetical protein
MPTRRLPIITGKALQIGSAVITETRDARVLGIREAGNAAVALRAAPGAAVELQAVDEASGKPRVQVGVLGQVIGHLGENDSRWVLEGFGAGAELEAFVTSVAGKAGEPEIWVTMNRAKQSPGPMGPRLLPGESRP